MDSISILIVEDDMDINSMLKDLLESNGYIANSAFSGTEAILCIEKNRFDIIILDLMLPGISGEDVLEKIRKNSDIPVIALSAKDDINTKVEVLKSGADDYITKPFNTDELIARIETVMRRNKFLYQSSLLKFKNLSIDQTLHEVKLNGEDIKLTKIEYSILELLMSNPKKVFTKNNIYESVYGNSIFTEDNTINVHISNIRRKLLSVDSDADYIQTVWGIGFKMNL